MTAMIRRPSLTPQPNNSRLAHWPLRTEASVEPG